MAHVLNYQLKKHMNHFRKEGRLALLLQFVLHANVRGRCWPSMDTLVINTGWNIASLTKAKRWLISTGAIEIVPYDKRVDNELELPQRQHVYQLTGTMIIKGESLDYLFYGIGGEEINPLASETSLSKTSLSKGKVYPVFKDSPDRSSLERPKGHSTAPTSQEQQTHPVLEKSPSDTQSQTPPTPPNAAAPPSPPAPDATGLTAIRDLLLIGIAPDMTVELATTENWKYVSKIWKRELKTPHASNPITRHEFESFCQQRIENGIAQLPLQDGLLALRFAEFRTKYTPPAIVAYTIVKSDFDPITGSHIPTVVKTRDGVIMSYDDYQKGLEDND